MKINILSDHHPQNIIIAKGDSAASKHYLKEKDSSVLSNIRPYSGTPVTLPDTDEIAPSNKGFLPLSNKLSQEAQTATTLPQLRSSSLISLGQICDSACTIFLNKNKLIAVKDANISYNYDPKEIILEGKRNKLDGLWDISVYSKHISQENYIVPPTHGLSTMLSPPIKHGSTPRNRRTNRPISGESAHPFAGLEGIIGGKVCNYLVDCQLKEDQISLQAAKLLDKHFNIILRKHETRGDLADFLHGACLSPVISTFIQAVDNNHFTTWPGLTTKLIRKHLTNKIRTAKGYINQERRHLQSTKPSQDNYDDYIKNIKQNILRLKTVLPEGASFEDILKIYILDDAFPSSKSPSIKINDVIYAIQENKEGLEYGFNKTLS